MVDVELTANPSATYQYTVTYSLFGDASLITSVTIEKEDDNTAVTARVLGEIPNLTWIDTPAAGPHTYEIFIAVTSTNIASAVAQTRSINAIIFG